MNKPNSKTRDVAGILHFLSPTQMAEEIVRLDRQLDGIQHSQAQAQPAQGLTDGDLLEWIGRQGDEFSVCILQDQPGDGDYYVSGAFHSGQGKTFREACIAAIQKGQQS